MVVGDSIMRSAVAPLQSRLVDRPSGRAATFNASGGLGVDDSRYVSSRIAMGVVATGGFDAIVINLGVNDTLAGYVTQDPAFHMGRILDAAGTTPVLWLNQAETLPNHEVAAVAYNAALRTAADQYPNLTIVDWGAVLDQHHEYLDPDNLHLNPRGQSIFAQLASDAIDAELGP
jgi:lysophospholipase L1-like esterase